MASAASTTWLLVTTTPSAEMMKPEPSDVTCVPLPRPSFEALERRAWREAREFFVDIHALAGGDIHHRRREPFGQVGEACRGQPWGLTRRGGDEDGGQRQGGKDWSEARACGLRSLAARAGSSMAGRRGDLGSENKVAFADG